MSSKDITSESAASITNSAAQQALCNELILERIFHYCDHSTSDLANYRLVCRAWYHVSLPEWRKTALLTIAQTGVPNDTSDNANAALSDEDFIRFYSENQLQLKSIPYRRYKVYWKHLSNVYDLTTSVPLFTDQNLKKVVRSLKFIFSEYDANQYNPSAFFSNFVSEKFPKLERFALNCANNKYSECRKFENGVEHFTLSAREYSFYHRY